MKNRKSLIKDAEENLRRCNELKNRAINLNNEAIGLEIDIQHTLDKINYFQKKEFEKICSNLRVGSMEKGKPVLYCLNPGRNCSYVSDKQAVIRTSKASFQVYLCKLAKDLHEQYERS